MKVNITTNISEDYRSCHSSLPFMTGKDGHEDKEKRIDKWMVEILAFPANISQKQTPATNGGLVGSTSENDSPIKRDDASDIWKRRGKNPSGHASISRYSISQDSDDNPGRDASSDTHRPVIC